MNKIDKILIIIGITLLAFIATCFTFSWFEKSVSPELIDGFFTLLAAEGGYLAWIKTHGEQTLKKIVNKLKGTKKNDSNN